MPKTAPEAPAPPASDSQDRESQGEDDVGGHAEQVSGDPRNHVDGDHAIGADQRLAQNAQVPQAPHVAGDMDETDMHEGGGQQAVPLAVQHQPGDVCAVAEQVVSVGSFGLTPCVNIHR